MHLTVVIPNYNHAQYLPQAIRSVFTQSVLPDRVLVVDDASTDNSRAVIARLQVDYPFEVIWREKNQGVIHNLNVCLREEVKEYVLFLAADDWILPGMLARELRLLARHPEAGMCSALMYEFWPELKHWQIMASPVPQTRKGYISPVRARTELQREGGWFCGSTAILKREAALACGGFQPELVSLCDNFLYQQIALRFGACFVARPFAVWRRLHTSYAHRTASNDEALAKIQQAVLERMQEASHIFGCSLRGRFLQRWRYFRSRQALDGHYQKFRALFLFIRLRYFDILPSFRRYLFYIGLRVWYFLQTRRLHQG